MTDRILYWTSVLFSLLALLLFLANAALINGNRKLQEGYNTRQTAINNAVSLTPLNQNLAQALAETSVKNDDKEIRDLLASQGITVRKPDKNKNAGDAAKPANKE